jgi:hypothetical protein
MEHAASAVLPSEHPCPVLYLMKSSGSVLGTDNFHTVFSATDGTFWHEIGLIGFFIIKEFIIC